MSLDNFIGAVGLIAWIASGLFLLGCLTAQDKLLIKWNAKDKKWVNEGNMGLNTHLNMENNPPQEFIEEFNNRPIKRYRWVFLVSIFGIFAFIFATN
ncbi:hypothetical protein [uncultured Roseibium sp.]|uniref:hypothetical protein n=1 Tax=uncultured Roseibium sp. TaxID=1936171 RepID=UPI00261739FE|nr:hypothetical protein [uncultured Roseibium sp.]